MNRKYKRNQESYFRLLTPATEHTKEDKIVIFRNKSYMESKYYTVTHKKNTVEKKWSEVDELYRNIKTYKIKWRKDLRSDDESITDDNILACIVELVYQTSSRIGSEYGSTSGEKTYGMSSLRKEHIIFKGNEIHIVFKGKKGVLTTYIISPNRKPGDDNNDTEAKKNVIEILEGLYNETDSDRLFIFANNKPVFPKDINRYLKSLGMETTVHKFRHYRSSTIVIEELGKFNKTSPTAKDVDDFVESVALKVGKILNHVEKKEVTGETAKKNYIDPMLLALFFARWNIRYPDWLLKILHDSDLDDDILNEK